MTGIEMADSHASPMDEVVSASVMSMKGRTERFCSDEFDIIVTDEAHHAAAKSYRSILSYFTPRLHLGFTATPNRSDNVRMDDIFEDIIFQRDLKWGIKNGYLSDIHCRRVSIGYDLSKVHTRSGDYAPGELEEAMDGTADAIAEAYRTMATGATLIFAVSVNQANEIAERIPGAAVVTAGTKDRSEVIRRFTDGEISCIVNVMVFTEGTDIPRVETVIVARPTQSDGLYAQMVGRGLRLYPGKERLNLVDCVGISGRASLCTAPSLLGIDLDTVPGDKRDEIEGDLFELPEKIASSSDCPQSWIRNVEIIDLWAKEQQYNLHGINFFKMPDGSLVCSLPERKRIHIPCQDELGRVNYEGRLVPMQAAIDMAYTKLLSVFPEYEYIWNLGKAKRWGSAPASEKQRAIIERRCKGVSLDGLSKLQASQILNRVMSGGRSA